VLQQFQVSVERIVHDSRKWHVCLIGDWDGPDWSERDGLSAGDRDEGKRLPFAFGECARC
jgi:hypothetical protein